MDSFFNIPESEVIKTGKCQVARGEIKHTGFVVLKGSSQGDVSVCKCLVLTISVKYSMI